MASHEWPRLAGTVQLESFAVETLDALRARGTHRQMRVLGGAQGTRMRVDGRDVRIFAGSKSSKILKTMIAASPGCAHLAITRSRPGGIDIQALALRLS